MTSEGQFNASRPHKNINFTCEENNVQILGLKGNHSEIGHPFIGVSSVPMEDFLLKAKKIFKLVN